MPQLKNLTNQKRLNTVKLMPRVEAKKVKPKCQTIIGRATQNLCQQVSDHIFSVAEDHLDVATLNHSADQVITDGNVSNFT